MLPIFKVYHQKGKDAIEHIYVFLNNQWIEDHHLSLDDGIDQLNLSVMQREIKNLSLIFSIPELEYIFREDIPITFLPYALHIDDTISIIKSKIIEKVDIKLSFPEIYLYGIHDEKFDTQSLYDKLTQNDEIPLTKERMIQFLQNFDKFNIDDFERIERDEFTYKDLLPYTENIEKVKFSIGQKFIIEKKYPFTVSPFDIFVNDPILEKYGDKIISTQNENLLMEYGNIDDNIIYMCIAEDVFISLGKDQALEKIFTKIYYPLLFKKKITNLQELRQNKQLLLETNKKLLDKNFTKYINNINLFYNLYYNRQVIIPVITRGIQYIHFIIHPTSIINFPLDIIFKLIHTTQNIPLSKWNPGKRRENIYRLYSPQISKDGRKIPILPKSEIMKLRRTIGRRKSVSLSIQLEKKNYIICEFFDNGNLSIKCSFVPSDTSIIDVYTVEDTIKKNISPILKKIQLYLEQSGYSYFEFENLHAPNIEIIDLTYIYSMATVNKISLKDIQNFQGCLTSFVNIMGDSDQDISLLYKRIAYFNEMDSIDAFITYYHKHDIGPNTIIKELEDNFNLTNKEALLTYSNWVNERQVERDRYENKKLKIISNPGFPIHIQWADGHANIIVNNINNIYYLEVLPIYLNSMIKLTQYKNFIAGEEEYHFTKRINSICKKGIANIKNVFDDIKASTEKKFSDQEVVTISDGLVTFDDTEVDEDLLDMFGGDSDDDEEEDEDIIKVLQSLSPDSDTASKIIDEPAAIQIQENIDGLALTNPNYFQKRLENADPILFLKRKQGKFKQYSRSCAVNIRRQPVLLTDKEFQKIKTEMPNKIKMAVKYGSDPKKRFWYVCPQYWCLTKNIPLTKEDLDEAKRTKTKLCGHSDDPYKNIIPRNAKKIPKGKYIYSRIDFAQKKRAQVQETLYPSFFVGKHPNPNYCIPCCFNKPGGKQTLNRLKCGAEVWDPHQEVQEVIVKTTVKTKVIKESNKYPLEKGQYGYLPQNIYDFLRIPYANVDCNIDGNFCVLRKGVEYSLTQSFIAAIATLYNPYDTPTIAQMKRKIKNSLTIDNFVTFQHGTLVDSFKGTKKDTIHSSYKEATIYKKLIKTSLGAEYLKEIISSYENFKRYLNDDTIEVDYEYLWDIICTPNNKLFKEGLNLVILVIPNNDITQNVDLICPSNHYANNLFHGKRVTAILLLRDNFYEPIVQRQKIARGKDNIRPLFSLMGHECPKECPWSLENIIRIMGKYISNKCKPYNRRSILFGPPDTPHYTMKENLSLVTIFKRLRRTKYEIVKQVVNLHTKVIGVIVRDKTDQNKKIFLPCAPSPIIMDQPWMLANSDTSWWKDYSTTVTMLQNIYELIRDKKKIPCKPIFKVIEDGKIIGVLTLTNQFIPTLPKTLEDTYSDQLIPYYINTNILEANKTIWGTTEKDHERLYMVKRIKLETNFYNTFRNTLRILLNQFKFKDIRESIENSIPDQTISYWQKLEQIVLLLKELLTPFIEFIQVDITNIELISTCLNLDAKTCNGKRNCGLSADEGTCKLLIPHENLISGNDNETIYYGRMADELIRYGRIRSFLLQQNKFISFQDIGYDLKDNEVLLLEETLIDEHNNYFANLEPIIVNKYVTYSRNFYNTEPNQ